jgi:hypothetical protein
VRWIGIDEAGYGPNLGPLVLTAVVAESPAEPRPHIDGDHRSLDFWNDLDATVDRAGGDPKKLWIDDSKAIFRTGKGRDRLEQACWAALHSAGHTAPVSIAALLAALGAGTPEQAEVSRWLEQGQRFPAFPSLTLSQCDHIAARRCFCPLEAKWSIQAVRSVLVGPARFNRELGATGLKSQVHFAAFSELLLWIWELAADGTPTYVKSDKHGGKHYYLPALCQAIPEAWIDRGPEGAELSRYLIRNRERALELSLMPRADRADGLVALASIVSKTVRELWMDVFNAYWRARRPDLRPTAGYPVDALRFRREIEAAALAEHCDPFMWWRNK